MVKMYSSIGLVMALYVVSIIYFCFPMLLICVFGVLGALVVVFYMGLLNVSLGSRVSPDIFGLMFMGNVVSSICGASCMLYSAESGVKRVHVDLYG